MTLHVQHVRFYTGFENYDALIAVFKCLEPEASRMHLWQGTDIGSLKYQNENINERGHKRKLSLSEIFVVLVRLKTGMFLLNLSERFDMFVSLILKTT